MESLDYRYHNVTYNKHTARYFADGSVRLVVAAEDPHTIAGAPAFVGNWVSTVGHACGTMCFRWVKPAAAHDGANLPLPRTAVMPLSAVARLDPSSAK